MGQKQEDDNQDNGMTCCYKANCSQCEHPGDWCSKSAAKCKDCGGVQMCTANKTKTESNSSSALSAAEVLAKMESSPKLVLTFGAFAGMVLLAGVFRRSRQDPSFYVPLVDPENA